ncbi:MAG TPA: FHA domain-containing protein [Gemmataceae bacterium]|nr:FHA domain-containing protein [Gemmataceae bacterium]
MPAPQPELPTQPPAVTRLESADEIREAIAAKLAAVKPAGEVEVSPFKPMQRPPMAVLVIVDDGQDDGERFRIRGDSCIIGRVEGDVKIPHDGRISSKHASITRTLEQGRYRWRLTDLQSTNGTWVRISNSVLKADQEIMIGGRRFRFHAGMPAAPPEEVSATKATIGWKSVAVEQALPALVELSADVEVKRFPLADGDTWIGRNPACNVVLADDMLVNGRHAKIYRDEKNRWVIENAQSGNGTWLRIDHIAFDRTCHFQLGEQRFIVRIS